MVEDEEGRRIPVMGGRLPFPSPVDHILSEISTMEILGRLGWPYTAWLSFIELDKAVVHVIRSTSFLSI